MNRQMMNDLSIQEKTEDVLAAVRLGKEKNIGLLTGTLGTTLTLFYATKQNSLYQEISEKSLKAVLRKISQQKYYSFSNGLAGIGWALEHLEQKGYTKHNTNILLEDFDLVLSHALDFEMKNGNYDFLHGALGIALYFINRIQKNESLLPILQRFIVQLNELGETQSTNSIKWISAINLEKQKMAYNISLSHGMSSIAVILSKLYAIKGIDQVMAKNLLQGCINYILEQEIDKTKYGTYFPSYAIESMERLQGSRLAWCYGDLGIAMALWQAGVALKNKTWENKALEILLFAAEKRRNLEQNYVKDAALCHGTAGIAHVFYRAWWNTRLPEFKNATEYWFEQTLKMATFTDGLAGYKTWYGEKKGWVNIYGLVEGIAGIGLALMTYYYEVEPTWDECLLLS